MAARPLGDSRQSLAAFERVLRLNPRQPPARFMLATIAHGLQYLAIVLVYHVRDRVREPGNRHGWLFHAATFRGTCLAFGYALFYCWPRAFVWAGAGLAESMPMLVATINVHHFVVDRYIWGALGFDLLWMRPRGLAIAAAVFVRRPGPIRRFRSVVVQVGLALRPWEPGGDRDGFDRRRQRRIFRR